MAELDPAHVEAVARAIDPVPFDNEANLPAWEFYREGALRHATYLLTSTDPAVHLALLAALVRAGVLSEEPTIEVHEDDRPTYYVGYGSQATYHPRRRYVTRWEDVDA